MSKLSSAGKSKLSKIENNISSFIVESGKCAEYLQNFKENKYSLFKSHFKDFRLDISTLNESKIIYFFIDKWDFYLTYRICCYSGQFSKIKPNKFQSNEIYKELVNINKQLSKWSVEQLTMFLNWLGFKADYINPTSKQLHIQIIDSLSNYKSFGPTLAVLQKKAWIKKGKYLMLDHNIEMDVDFINIVRYKNDTLRICAQDKAKLEIAEDVLGFVKESKIQDIISLIMNSSSSKKQYYNLEDFKIVSAITSNKTTHRNDNYCICSNNTTMYNAYLKILSSKVSEHAYRQIENCKLILANLESSEPGYINIDNWKKNKTARKPYKHEGYRIIGSDENKFNYYLHILQHDNIFKPIDIVQNSSPSDTTKPKKRKAIPQKVRYQVWRNAFGKSMDGYCICCHDAINIEGWDCGHIEAHAEGGKDSADNLRPICGSCNRSMGKTNMLVWMKEYAMPGLSKFK